MNAPPSSRPMRVLLVAIAAAIAYAELPFEALAGFPLDPSTSLLSDLDAHGQPGATMFAATEIVAGALILALAAMCWRSASGVLERVSVIVLGLFGLDSFVDGFVPLPCSPTSGRCATGGFEATGAASVTDIVHSVTSVGATVLGLALALVFAAVAFGLLGARVRPRATRLLMLAALATLLVSSAILSYLLGQPGSGTGYAPGTGWAQRVQTIASAVDVAAAAFLWLRTPGGI